MAEKEGMIVFDEAAVQRLEARSSTPEYLAVQQAILDALELQPGEQCLDIGSGTGYLACEMAQRVGGQGHVAAIDASRPLLAHAQLRAERLDLAKWMDFHESDATSLPFPDSTFDAATSIQVLEYVPDVFTALSEAYRVLRPGGRLVLVDMDWDTFIVETDDPELMTRVARVWSGHLAHNHLPRQLSPLLRRAGFWVAGVKGLPMVNIDFDPSRRGYSLLLESIAPYVRGWAGLSSADVDAWVADLHRQAANGTFWFSVTQYLFLARKPAEAGHG